MIFFALNRKQHNSLLLVNALVTIYKYVVCVCGSLKLSLPSARIYEIKHGNGVMAPYAMHGVNNSVL